MQGPVITRASTAVARASTVVARASTVVARASTVAVRVFKVNKEFQYRTYSMNEPIFQVDVPLSMLKPRPLISRAQFWNLI